MKGHVVISIRMTIVLVTVTCAIYPAIVYVIGQIAFKHQANGSLITMNGRVIGSELIGQNFSADRYFRSRPSAVDYDAMHSGGSNLGPTSKKLRDTVAARLRDVSAAQVPADAVTASASGVDPHISPQNAFMQVERVARTRGISEARLHAFVKRRIEPRFIGIFGEPRVNVLLLNLDLDRGVS